MGKHPSGPSGLGERVKHSVIAGIIEQAEIWGIKKYLSLKEN